MPQPPAKTIEGFAAGLSLLANYLPDGPQAQAFCYAEWEVITFCVSVHTLPETSDSGGQLRALGFEVSGELWAYFT